MANQRELKEQGRITCKKRHFNSLIYLDSKFVSASTNPFLYVLYYDFPLITFIVLLLLRLQQPLRNQTPRNSATSTLLSKQRGPVPVPGSNFGQPERLLLANNMPNYYPAVTITRRWRGNKPKRRAPPDRSRDDDEELFVVVDSMEPLANKTTTFMHIEDHWDNIFQRVSLVFSSSKFGNPRYCRLFAESVIS